MSAIEPTLPNTNLTPQRPYSPLPSVLRAIEYNLPPNYRRQNDPQHGWHWIYQVNKTNLSARVYPNIEADTINISIVDDSKTSDTAEGEIIKKWSGDLRMTGNWRRRLRRSSGEALVLVNQRPKCPSCRKPLVLRQRRDNHQQFFGCEDYPRCSGSITITDHDVDRNRAGSYRPPVGQNGLQMQASSR